MATADSSPGDGALLSTRDLLLAEVGDELRKAHSLASGLLDRQQPRPTARSLIQIALGLRRAIALVEAEERARRGAPIPPTPTQPVRDLYTLARAVLYDDRQPFALRLHAQEALLNRNQAPPSPSRTLFQLAEWIDSSIKLLGASLQEASERAAQSEEWKGLSPRAIRVAFLHHQRALSAVERRS